MIATTKEQALRLLRCGVLADTADMSIRTITEPMIRDVAEWETPLLLTMPYSSAKDIYRGDYVEPAWSLSALLGLLPKFIPDAGGDFSYALKIQPCNLPGWTVCYYAYSLDKGKGYHRSEDIIEACVQLIEWLTRHNYKLNYKLNEI